MELQGEVLGVAEGLDRHHPLGVLADGGEEGVAHVGQAVGQEARAREGQHEHDHRPGDRRRVRSFREPVARVPEVDRRGDGEHLGQHRDRERSDDVRPPPGEVGPEQDADEAADRDPETGAGGGDVVEGGSLLGHPRRR